MVLGYSLKGGGFRGGLQFGTRVEDHISRLDYGYSLSIEGTKKMVNKVPRLWRIKDPVKLMGMGQLLLPGLAVVDSRTIDQAWTELLTATSHKIAAHARLNTGLSPR